MLCDAIDRSDLIPLALQFTAEADAQLKHELQIIFKERTFREWQVIFANVDACVEPVLTFEETLTHPLFEARDMFFTLEQENGQQQTQLACPIKSNRFKPHYRPRVQNGAQNETFFAAKQERR